MPYKPKRGGAQAGCPNLTDGYYCPDHAKAEARRYNKHDRDPDSNKRYGRAWKKIRASFLSANPLCELCRRDGKLTPATMVHHQRRLKDGGTNDKDNLVSLCHICHSKLHAAAGDRWG